MWPRTALILALVTTLATRVRTTAQESDRACPLIHELNWVRFDVVMGRFVIASSRLKQGQQRARREAPDGTLESLAASLDRGLTSLHYTLESDTREVRLRVVRRDQLELRWSTTRNQGAWQTIVYEQEPGDGVRLRAIGATGETQVCTAPSLWHLLLLQRNGTSSLIAALQSLRPDWNLQSQCDALCRHLLNMDARTLVDTPQEIQLLVEQLGHAEFRVRQQADRALRARGRSVLGLLNETDFEQLDSEQKLRIGEIRRSLTDYTSDTPQSVATWLCNDRHIWLSLLEQGEPADGMIARNHLERLTNRRIDYDPYATPESRVEQMASLRTELRRR